MLPRGRGYTPTERLAAGAGAAIPALLLAAPPATRLDQILVKNIVAGTQRVRTVFKGGRRFESREIEQALGILPAGP